MRTFGVAQVCLILIATCFPFFLPGEERKEGRKGGREEGGEVAQLCMTLGDPVDCNLPGSSVHGILQARTMEWVAISFSRALVKNFPLLKLPSPDTHTHTV